jgi:hypothetical protein
MGSTSASLGTAWIITLATTTNQIQNVVVSFVLHVAFPSKILRIQGWWVISLKSIFLQRIAWKWALFTFSLNASVVGGIEQSLGEEKWPFPFLAPQTCNLVSDIELLFFTP